MVMDEVTTVVTPGETIDAIVTERGIAVNPRRKDLYDCFKAANLNVMDIHDLKKIAENLTGVPEKLKQLMIL